MQNFYDMGARAVEAGRQGGPFAFIIPPEQHDPHAATKLRELLLDGGVEIQRALEPFRADGEPYPAGTDIILMAQPYRAYVKTLLEQQDYPARAWRRRPPERPYDVAGWTLPMQMGVEVDRIEQTFEPPPSTTAGDDGDSAGRRCGASGSASYYVIDGARQRRSDRRSTACSRPGSRSRGCTSAARRRRATATTAARSLSARARRSRRGRSSRRSRPRLGLRATGIRGALPTTMQPVGRDRGSALYKPWVENIDEGWTRWLLEQYEFPFEIAERSSRSAAGACARVSTRSLFRTRRPSG